MESFKVLYPRFWWPSFPIVILRGGSGQALGIVHTMLESLELTSLKSIRNGIVNVFSNPDLCFAETVNWSMIVSEPKKKNNIMTNKPMEDCGKICNCFKGQWHNHVKVGTGGVVTRLYATFLCDRWSGHSFVRHSCLWQVEWSLYQSSQFSMTGGVVTLPEVTVLYDRSSGHSTRGHSSLWQVEWSLYQRSQFSMIGGVVTLQETTVLCDRWSGHSTRGHSSLW